MLIKKLSENSGHHPLFFSYRSSSATGANGNVNINSSSVVFSPLSACLGKSQVMNTSAQQHQMSSNNSISLIHSGSHERFPKQVDQAKSRHNDDWKLENVDEKENVAALGGAHAQSSTRGTNGHHHHQSSGSTAKPSFTSKAKKFGKAFFEKKVFDF